MPLNAGEQLGHYTIQSLIGQGGMGEVYSARDTKLDREVAIKVLPASLSSDSERLARFEREAKVLASLNHPGIAAIYGVEDRALVMEMVPGPTLADRIGQGPIPPAEVEEILLQIADAMEYAHERGIVHRDLKPANIKIDLEDKVKILDFGLAKALSAPIASTASNPTVSPTITMGATIAGAILGTAAYMAPEQARGKKVDKRADIWAFGVVVYEMLAGERLFQGDDAVQVLSRVLEQKVDLERVPAKFRKLLARCLDRNPKDRLRDIGEARFLLEEPAAEELASVSAAPSPAWLSFVPWAVAGISVLALGTLATVHFREQRSDTPKPVRFQFTPENVAVGSSNQFALSPDGTKLAYYAAASDGVTRLWIRSMDTLESRPFSAAGLVAQSPIFWSYDSRFLVFHSAGKLRKIDSSGGPAQSLCDASGLVVGGSWNREGTILFGGSGPLLRVSSAGGTATPVTALDSTRSDTAHLGPVFLPDGRHFLYLRSGKPESRGIYLGSLDAKPEQQSLKRLLASDYAVEFVPFTGGNSGEILLLREGTLYAQPFDLSRLELSGEAVPVAEQVGSFRSGGDFSSSRTGALVYRSGFAGDSELAWFDRQGKTLGTPTDAFYGPTTLALSPDGSQVVAEHRETTGSNLWLVDLARVGRTRFTYAQSIDEYAAWSPDGTKIAFSSNRAGQLDLYQHAANGAGEDQLLLKSDNNKRVMDWSRDGRFLLFDQPSGKRGTELWMLPMDTAGERKPVPFFRSEFDTRATVFARWPLDRIQFR